MVVVVVVMVLMVGHLFPAASAQPLTVSPLGTWPLPTSRTRCPPLSLPHFLAHAHTQAWRHLRQPPALAAWRCSLCSLWPRWLWLWLLAAVALGARVG